VRRHHAGFNLVLGDSFRGRKNVADLIIWAQKKKAMSTVTLTLGGLVVVYWCFVARMRSAGASFSPE